MLVPDRAERAAVAQNQSGILSMPRGPRAGQEMVTSKAAGNAGIIQHSTTSRMRARIARSSDATLYNMLDISRQYHQSYMVETNKSLDFNPGSYCCWCTCRSGLVLYHLAARSASS